MSSNAISKAERAMQMFQSEKNKIDHIKGFHDTAGGRKVSQILFDARDGREVFTPFR